MGEMGIVEWWWKQKSNRHEKIKKDLRIAKETLDVHKMYIKPNNKEIKFLEKKITALERKLR